jgi:hypothetical protein
MDTLYRKPSVVEELSKEPTPPLALMTRPPADPLVREGIGNQVWAGIVLRFESTLSERDKHLWHAPPADPGKSAEHMRVLHMFDDFLLSQFAEWGWRMFMSPGVIQRLTEWEKHSPAMLERLGRELALRSRVLRGEKAAPLAEDIENFADSAIEELQRLLRRQRDKFGAKTRAPSCREVSAWMKSEIESRPMEFPFLLGNLAQLCGWVETLPAKNPDAGRTLRRGDLRARGFFYAWYAACSNRSPRDVRNLISRLRTRR